MAKEKEAQKDVEKQLRTEVKKLKTMSLSLDEDQEKLFRAKEAIGKAMFFYLKYSVSQTYEATPKLIKRGPTQLNFKLFCIKYPTFFPYRYGARKYSNRC